MIGYNEKKVAKGQGECIHAGNYLKDAEQLSVAEKKERFKEVMELNRQTRNKGVSLVIQFAPGERLSRDELLDVSADMMKGIGFERQPYLLYEHYDTFHQHMHLVTTNIRHDGKKIEDHWSGIRQVQPTCRAVEEKYGLMRGKSGRIVRHDPTKKVQYGKEATFEAVSGTLHYVLDNYGYGSLPELNAVLRLYNLRAYPGRPGGKLHENRGLLYQVLDEEGKPMHAPIKAGSIPYKPMLDFLERRFAANGGPDERGLRYTRYLVDQAVGEGPGSSAEFREVLRRRGLEAVALDGSQGPELFFVDMEKRRVMAAGDLGDGYTAEALGRRLGFDPAAKMSHALDVSLSQEVGLEQEYGFRKGMRR